MGTAFETEKKRFLGKFCLTDSGELLSYVLESCIKERERDGNFSLVIPG